MSRRLSSFLDASRWIAALLVVFSHVRELLLADPSAVTHLRPSDKLLYILSNLGHEAVVVFFVISGLLVGGVSVQKLRSGRFSLDDYAASRFSRIYVVLIPALLVGGALDLVGARLADQACLYSTVAPLGISSLSFHEPVVERLNWLTLLGNLFMLERIRTEVLGSNGPLWSLVYEWWYYCLFAAGVVTWLGRSAAIRFIALAAGIGLAFALPFKLLLWGGIWLIGLGCGLYMRSSLPKPQIWAGVLLAMLGLVVSKGCNHFDPAGRLEVAFVADLATALGYGALLLSFAAGAAPLPGARWHRWAADFSYSTYLAHFPMLLLLCALAHRWLGASLAAQPSASAWLAVALLAAATLVYCYLFSRVTEVFTPQVKAWLRRDAALVASVN